MTGKRTYRPTEAEGFSLLELVVVLTILAGMTMMVTPIFNGSLSGAEVEHSMRDLHAMLKSARSLAMSEGNEYRVYFHPKENRYWIGRWSGLDEKGERVFTPSSDIREANVKLPSSVKLLQPTRADYDRKRKAYYVTFYPSGVCSPAGTKIMVNVGGKRSQQYVFELAGLSIEFKEPAKR